MAYTLANLLIRLSADVKSAVSELEEARSRLSGLKDVAKTAAGVLLGELAHDALGAVTSITGEAARGFMNYEQTLAAIIASSGETGEAAKKLREELENVAMSQADLGFSAAEAAAGLESLVKAGLTGSEAAEALRASLEMAKIEGISTAEASNMLVGVMNQFGYAASDASKVVDTLVNASIAGVDSARDFALGLSYCGAQAASMGLSLQETVAALVAMNNQGIAAEKAGRYLGAMLTDLINKSKGGENALDGLVAKLQNGEINAEEFGNKIFDLLKEAGAGEEEFEVLGETLFDAIDAFQNGIINAEEFKANLLDMAPSLTSAAEGSSKLGFSIYDSSGKMLSLSEIIANLRDKLASFATDEERNAYLTEVFGTQGARAALSLLNMGESLDELTNKLKTEGSANEYVNQILNTTAGRLSQARAKMENASYGLGGLTAQLQIAWNQFAAGLGPIGAVTEALGPSMLQGAITGLTMNLPVLGGALKSLGGVLVGLGPAGWAIGAAIAGVTALYAAYQTNFMGMRDIVDKAVADIQNMLGGLADAAQNTWKSITSAFTDFGNSIVEGATDLYNMLVGGSIWTDMMEEMINETDRSLGQIAESLNKLTPQVSMDLTKASGELKIPAPMLKTPVTMLGEAAGRSININIDVHDNRISDEIDESDLARRISEEMIDGLRRHGVIP